MEQTIVMGTGTGTESEVISSLVLVLVLVLVFEAVTPVRSFNASITVKAVQLDQVWRRLARVSEVYPENGHRGALSPRLEHFTSFFLVLCLP